MNRLKTPRYKNPAYLAWVKSLPCAMTGQEPAGDPHHLIGIGGMSGTGLTAPDWAAMPLTREAHDRMHREPELWHGQWEMIARTLGKAIDEGKLRWVK